MVVEPPMIGAALLVVHAAFAAAIEIMQREGVVHRLEPGIRPRHGVGSPMSRQKLRAESASATIA